MEANGIASGGHHQKVGKPMGSDSVRDGGTVGQDKLHALKKTDVQSPEPKITSVTGDAVEKATSHQVALRKAQAQVEDATGRQASAAHVDTSH